MIGYQSDVKAAFLWQIAFIVFVKWMLILFGIYNTHRYLLHRVAYNSMPEGLYVLLLYAGWMLWIFAMNYGFYFVEIAFGQEMVFGNPSSVPQIRPDDLEDRSWKQIPQKSLVQSLLSLIVFIPVYIRNTKRFQLQAAVETHAQKMRSLEELTAKTQLEALQAKVKPHFLYNALNSIAGLIYTEPEKAERVVLGLADLFRHSINREDEPFVRLADELHIAQIYLDIEHIRFGEQLSYSIDVQEELEDWLLPRFLLQPLLENAIQHGTSKQKQGKLSLSISTCQNGILIRISDNGPPFPGDLFTGFGIKGIYEKLDLLVPGQYSLEFENEPQKQVSLSLFSLDKT